MFFYSPRQIFRSRVTSKAVKIKIYTMMVKTVVVFWSETWAVSERDVTRLGYMGEESIKNGTWTGGGSRNSENKN
jgi:hypothetical protein